MCRFTDFKTLDSPTLGPLLPPLNIPGTCFCQRLIRTQCHSTAGSIMWVKMCSDSVGNVRRYLPACSAVRQPTTTPRATEGHLINSDVHSCTHITAVILFVPPCRTGHLDVFQSYFNLQTFDFFSITPVQFRVYQFVFDIFICTMLGTGWDLDISNFYAVFVCVR